MTDTGNNLFTLNGNDKNATGIAHAVGEQSGIPWIHHDDVGILQRPSFLINEAPDEAAFGLEDGFDVDFVVLPPGHLDGIETNHLADGVGHGLVLDRGRHLVVLQVVIDEDDLVAACVLLQIFQGIAHRHVTEGVRDTLCNSREQQGKRQAHEQSDCSLHGQDYFESFDSTISWLPSCRMEMASKLLSISTTLSSEYSGSH